MYDKILEPLINVCSEELETPYDLLLTDDEFKEIYGCSKNDFTNKNYDIDDTIEL